MSDTPRTDQALEAARKVSTEDDEFYRSAAGLLSALARELEDELAAANRSADACLEEIDRLRARLNASSK